MILWFCMHLKYKLKMNTHCSACTCLLNFTESLQCCNKRPQRVSPNSCGASDTHTHTNRMQSIGFSVRIKTSICKHTLHCVTVATNGTLYTWLWTVRQLLGTSLCILCVCCGQCLPEKKLSSISTVGVTHIPFRSKEESWNHIFIYEVPFRQKANHFPQCTPQAKPRRVAAKHKYPRACWQPGKRNIEPSVW